MTKPRKAVQPQADGLYSEDAEKAVLGCLLVNPDQTRAVMSILDEDDFYLLRHRLIFKAMTNLAERRDAIDMLTAMHELKAMNALNDIGGPAYLTDCYNAAPNTTNLETYARIVMSISQRRKIIAAGQHIVELAKDASRSLDEVLGDAQQAAAKALVNPDRATVISAFDAISEYYERIEKALLGESKLWKGIPSGFRDLDSLTGGFSPGELWIFAGRPGMGKSAFLLSVANNMTCDPTVLEVHKERRNTDDLVVLFVSMEMDIDQLCARLIALNSGLNVADIRQNRLTPGNTYASFVAGAGKVAKARLAFSRATNLTPNDLRATIMEAKLLFGRVDVVIVDYLQLMSGGPGFPQGQRVQEVSLISRELKNIAGEFDVPVLSAAQLSRAVEQRQDKRPVLSDLRESGSIEQDGDGVMFLYRDEVYNDATEFPNQAEIIIAKQRNGPTGTVHLYYEPSLTRFMNAAERYVDLSVL